MNLSQLNAIMNLSQLNAIGKMCEEYGCLPVFLALFLALFFVLAILCLIAYFTL
jgi:hypothetical protein